MKETIKIAYADFWPEWYQNENFITPILEKHYNVVIDQNNPDVLFHSIFNGRKDTPKYKCKKVLILAENWRPKQIGSDFSISFDKDSDTNFRLPLWQIYWLLWPELKDRLFNRNTTDVFSHFASFTVSNASNQLRNSHFDQLHKYKRVQSYGKVRTNNLKLQQLSKGRYWRDAKDDYFLDNPHKFMMAYENTSYPGYCTEKLMDSFLVGSIPVYWGDPLIKQDWNEKAFINANDYPGDKLVKRIKEIDNDSSKFADIYYNEPVFTDEQKNRHIETLERFENWIINKVKE